MGGRAFCGLLFSIFRTMNALRRCTAVGLVAFALSCQSSGGNASADGSDADACGLPTASSQCESVTWPRIAIAFGDSMAANLSFTFTANDGFVSREKSPCPMGYGESTSLHCDVGFYANPAETEVTVQVVDEDSGTVEASSQVQLMPFNRCGAGIAQLIATIGDAGTPELGPVQYVSACGSL